MDENIPRAEWWNEFFKEAGIPVGLSASYGVTFAEHRISLEQICDLDAQLLKMMDIQALGHVMTILKYATNFTQFKNSKNSTNQVKKNIIKDYYQQGSMPLMPGPAMMLNNGYMGYSVPSANVVGGGGFAGVGSYEGSLTSRQRDLIKADELQRLSNERRLLKQERLKLEQQQLRMEKASAANTNNNTFKRNSGSATSPFNKNRTPDAKQMQAKSPKLAARKTPERRSAQMNSRKPVFNNVNESRSPVTRNNSAHSPGNKKTPKQLVPKKQYKSSAYMDKPKTPISVHRRTQSIPQMSTNSFKFGLQANRVKSPQNSPASSRRVSFDNAAKSKSIQDRIGPMKNKVSPLKSPSANFANKRDFINKQLINGKKSPVNNQMKSPKSNMASRLGNNFKKPASDGILSKSPNSRIIKKSVFNRLG